MAAVTFLGSSGIRTPLQGHREAIEQRIVLRLVYAHRRVTKILEITGSLELLRDGTFPD